MRKPDRLDTFYDELKNIHKQFFPDWRFGQLINNLERWLFNSDRTPDIFHLEEDEFLEYLNEFAEKFAD